MSIRTPDGAVARRFDRLFAAMPEPAPGDDVLDVWIDIARTELDEPWYELFLGDEHALGSRWLWRCEDRILAHLNRWTLDTDGERLHLHAGLVSNERDVVLIVGPSGSGKSTLVAALVQAGWTYHTDEMLAVDTLDGSVTGYPRPLTLKRGSWRLFPALPTITAARSEPSREKAHVPPDELGTGATETVAAPTAIVVLGPTAESASSRGIPSIDAALAMAGEALDLERAGPRAMATIVQLAAGLPCIEVDPGDLDGTVELLTAALTSATEPTSPAEAFRAEQDAVLRPTVMGWTLGDVGLLYDVENGTIVRLDSSGLATSRVLASCSSVDAAATRLAGLLVADAPTVRADVAAFVDHLSRAGLVAGDA